MEATIVEKRDYFFKRICEALKDAPAREVELVWYFIKGLLGID